MDVSIGEVLGATTRNVGLFTRLGSAFYRMAPGAHPFLYVDSHELCSAKKSNRRSKSRGKLGGIG